MAEQFGRVGRLWQHAGLFCLMVEPYNGRRTGYVRVPEDHPWHGIDYNDAVPHPGESPYLGRPASDAPFGGMIAALFGGVDEWLAKLDGQVMVHGGLTFSSERTAAEWDDSLDNGDGVPGGWWIGFDTGHAGDEADESIMDEKHLRLHREYHLFHDGEVRTAEYVSAQIEHLAEQVAAAALTLSGVGGNPDV